MPSSIFYSRLELHPSTQVLIQTKKCPPNSSTAYPCNFFELRAYCVIMVPMQEISEYPDKAAPVKKRNFLGIGLALLLAAGAFFSGLQLGTDPSNPTNLEAGLFSLFASVPSQPDGVDLTEFWRVWDILEEKFVISSSSETVTTEDKLLGAIDGLVGSYDDPYTVYLPPNDTALFEEDISGNFGGVGMEVGIRNRVVTVITPLPDTPAEEAGILPGDMIVKINDTSTERMSIDEAVRLIRGEIGTAAPQHFSRN